MFQEIDRLNNDIWSCATNNPAGSLKDAYKALELSNRNEYPLGRAESLLNIGRCLIFTSEYNEAKKKLGDALEAFRKIADERAQNGEMRCLNALGVTAFEMQDYESALNYYFMALTESEISRTDEVRILALNNIGEIHRQLNNIEEALSYYHQSLQLAEITNDKLNIGGAMINLGETYLSLKDISEAEGSFSRALAIAEENNHLQLKADSLIGLGRGFILKEEYFGAEDRITGAAEIYEKINDRIGLAECSYYFGLIGLQNSKYADAEKYFLTARETAEELNQTELLSRCMKRLSEIYKAIEKYQESLGYFEEFYRFEKELQNDALRNRLKKITILYETEQTENEKESYRMQSLSLEKTNKEIKFINEIGQEITSSLDLDEIIYNTYIRLAELLDISSFGVALYDKENEEIRFSNIVENGEKLKPFTIPAGSETSIAAWAIRNKKPILTNKKSDVYKYLKKWSRSPNQTIPINSAIFMPMTQGSRMVGCLTIQNSRENAYTESDLNTIGAVSTFLAIALDNSRIHTELNNMNDLVTNEKKGLEVAYRRIAHMANHDSLTDLPNRHLLHELLERSLKLAEREKSSLAILYMDLDKFKPINDTLGHDSGDLVLKIVSERLREVLRTSDIIARIGGDEFVAVLNNIESEEGTASAAAKIISSLGKEIKLKGRTFRIGVSIGIAIFPENDISIDGLMLKADKAMYKAKQSGRNKAVFFKK